MGQLGRVRSSNRIRCRCRILGHQAMKRRVMKAVGLALALAGAFGAGMWFMYFIQWVDVFTKFMEMTEKVFK